MYFLLMNSVKASHKKALAYSFEEFNTYALGLLAHLHIAHLHKTETHWPFFIDVL